MPDGEVAVVGLATQRPRGRRAPRARAVHEVYASDAADRRRHRAARASELRAMGVDVRRRAGTTSSASRARRSSSSSPGVPPTRRRSPRRATPGVPIVSEIEIAPALPAAAALHRHHRHQRQDDDDGAHRPPAARARPSTRPPPATSARRSPSSRCAEPHAGVGRARAVVVPAARHAEHRPDGRRAHQPRARIISIGTRASRSTTPTRRCSSRTRRAESQWVVERRRRRRAGAGRQERPRRSSRFSVRRRRGGWHATTATRVMLVVLGQPSARPRRAAAARRSQRRERARRGARRAARQRVAPTADARRTSRDGLAHLHALRASHASRSARSAACSGSTTPSRRTSRRPTSRCEGMTRPTVLLLGGRHKGEPYTALRRAVRRTGTAVLAYGEAAPHDRAAISRTSCRWSGSDRRFDDVDRARARRWRSPATPCCSRPRARATTCSTTTSSAGAALQGACALGSRIVTVKAMRPTRRDVAGERVADGRCRGDAGAGASSARVAARASGWRCSTARARFVAMHAGSRQRVSSCCASSPGAAAGVRRLRDRRQGRRRAAGATGRGRSWASRSSLMLLVVLPLPEAIAPRIHGSRAFSSAARSSRRSSAKLGVIVWVSMLIVKKGDDAAPPDARGSSRSSSSSACSTCSPRSSRISRSAMLFTLLMALLLFVGGARIGHFIALGALAIPVLWRQIERAAVRAAPHDGVPRPGRRRRQRVNYQLKQSLIAVGSGGAFGRRLRRGHAAGRLPALPVQRLHRQQHRRGVGLRRALRAHARLRDRTALLGFRIARQARTPFLQLVAVGLTFTTRARPRSCTSAS